MEDRLSTLHKFVCWNLPFLNFFQVLVNNLFEFLQISSSIKTTSFAKSLSYISGTFLVSSNILFWGEPFAIFVVKYLFFVEFVVDFAETPIVWYIEVSSLEVDVVELLFQWFDWSSLLTYFFLFVLSIIGKKLFTIKASENVSIALISMV